MKNHLSKLFYLSLGAVLFTSPINADLIDNDFDVDRLKGSKIGYYIGSFDPIHIGHQHVIEQALKSGHVDYILIYPAPGGDQFKNRTDLTIRQKMIASIYQKHPKVLYTYWTPKQLQDAFSPLTNDLEVIGVIGSDVITDTLMGPDEELSKKYQSVFMRGIPLTEKHYNDTVGALMALKADSFLVALRGDIDLSYLKGNVHDRPIRGLIRSDNYSSTEVRNAIQNKQPFEHFVSLPVETIIKLDGLYGYKGF